MPQYQIEIPGQGKFQIDSPTELTDDQVYAAVQAQLGDLPAPKKGLGAAAAKGLESLISSSRTGIAGLIGSPEEAATAGLERGKGISTEYADQIGFDKVKEAYGRGLLPAAGEVARQVPLALAEQFPNLAAMAGSARAGAMAGARMGPYGAIAGGLGGALIPSALQQFGGNIERQAAEQQALGQPVTIDRGAALAATAPQAALDVASTYIPLGGRLVGKLVGIPEKALLKDTTGKVAKLAEEKLLATLAKGTATGALAEVPAEVAQQMLERAQAGLSLTDQDALNEYGETIYQTALLAPIGAAGRLSERGGARMEVEKQKQEEKRQAQIAQAEQDEQLAQQKQAVEAAAAAHRQTPRFAMDADVKYTDLQKQIGDLLAASKAKVDPTDLAGIAAKKEAAQKLEDLKASDEYKQTIADWRETAPMRAKMQAEREAAEAAQAAAQQQRDDAAAAQAAQQQAAQMQQQETAGPFRQQMLPGMEEVEPPAAPTAPAPSPDAALQFAQKKQELEQLQEDNKQQQSAATAKGDTAEWKKARKQGELLDNEYAYVTKQLKLLGGYSAPAADAGAIQAQLDEVKEALKTNTGKAYDAALADEQVAKIDELTAKMAEYGGVQQTLDLGRPKKLAPAETAESFNARVAETEKTKQQIAQAEAEGKAKVGPETEALQRIGQRPKPANYDLFEQEEKAPSAAMGQMQQSLLQEERTVTGEADKELKAKQPRRVAGTGEFKLTSFQTPLEKRANYDDLKQRLAQLMARNDLSPEAYSFLSEVERNLPASDVAVTTEAAPGMKPGVKFLTAAQEQRIAGRKDAIAKLEAQLKTAETAPRRASLEKQITTSKQMLAQEEGQARPMKPGATTGESFYSLLDKQLTQIERGEEGIDTRKHPRYREFTREGIPALETKSALLYPQLEKTTEGTRTTIKQTPVQERKIVKRRTKGTLFVPTGAPALSLQEQLEPLVARAKYAKEETPVGQGELFKAQPKETGYIKEDRAAFERLQKSPFVRKYFKQLKDATEAVGNAEKQLSTVRPQVEELSKKLYALTKAQNEITSAVMALKTGQQLPTLAQDLATIAANRTDAVIQRMQLQAQVDQLLKDRADRVAFINAIEGVSAADKAMLIEKLDGVTEQLQQADAEMIYIENALAVQQANIDVALAKQKLEQLLGAEGTFKEVDLPAQIAKVQKELAEARAEAVKAETALKKALSAREEKGPEDAAAKVKARAAEVTAAAERAAEREAVVKEENRRIQDVYAEEGRQYTALEESERFRREAKTRGDMPVITVADQKQLLFVEQNKIGRGTKDPLQVLGGYRSRISDLEKKIHLERVRTRQYVFAEIEPLKQKYEKLDAAYKAEKSGDVRAEMLPKLLAAEAKYLEAYRVASNKPITFKGQAKVYAELERAYIKEEWLSKLINSGQLKVGYGFEKPLKLTAKEKKAARAARQNEVVANKRAALEEGEAPMTTGESLTRMQEAAARRSQGTLYQSKGADYATLERERKEKKEQPATLLRPAEGVARSVLTELATKRLDIADIDRALEYIEKNPSATAEGKARQATAKKDLRARRKVADKERIALSKEQQAFVTAQKELAVPKPKEESNEATLLKEELPPDVVGGEKYRTVEGQAPVTPMPVEELNKLIASIQRSLGGKAEITVLDSVTDIDPKQKAGTRAGALINGKLYLFRDGIADGVEGMKTIYHELFHKGLANLMDRNEYTTLMNKLYDQSANIREASQSWYKKHVADVEAYRREYVAANPDANASTLDDATRAHIVEEVLAQMAETRKPPGLLQQMRNWFAGIAERFGMSALAKHIRGMEQGPLEQLIDDALRASVRGNAPDNRTLFRSTATYANDTLAEAGAIGNKFIAQNQSMYDKIKANGSGLAFETSYVDRFAGFERLAKIMPSLKGTQMMYFLRMYDQRMNFVSQSVSRGALQRIEKTRPDGGKEFLIESVDGPSLKGVVETLKEANEMVGSGQGVNRLFTLYLSAIRAKDKGLDALHFGTALTQADLDKAMKAIEDTPGLEAIFKRARDEYNAYNKGMINFAVQAGAIKKDVAADLLKQNDYIPWYRQRNGVAELVIGKETPIHVGSIASQPYLQELVGGDAPILDFMTSSVQNTNMLTDMSLRNLATKNSVMELVEMKLAKLGHKNLAGPNIVKFRIDGEDVAAMIDTDTVGVPADILVKGMEGIPVQLSGLMRILGAPSVLLRRAITLSPVYVARQLFRDSLAAPILSGADFTPIVGALKEINSAAKPTLERRGITGGQIFTGGSEDLTKILQDITDGKSTWMQGIGKLESLNMEADALTRRAQYNSYIKQGLSEMEATLMSLESMNFNKRGASPSIHLANSLIPFFNAQIQSMNVLYKALRGQLPFNERLRIKQKLLERGFLVAGITATYVVAMQDDEAYKNATPDQKYGNWFFRIPGIDEPLKMPIPFEIGYVFKAIPEALINTMVNEHGGEEAVDAFLTIFKSLIPGGTSFGVPQALKPAIEAKLGKSFFTGRDTLTPQEKGLLPEAQFRAETTEASKYIGSALGVAPITLDNLVQGYTGTMGLAFLQAVSMGLPTKGQGGPEQAYKRLSEMPVIGGVFQPNDAGGIINSTYEKMLEIQKLDSTIDGYINRGMKADAKELIAQRGNEYMMSEMAGEYISTIKELTQYENAVRASDRTPEEKREKLNEIRQMKIRYSAQTRQAADKTTLQ